VTSPVIVAEIGGNHRGELGTALRMVEIIGGYCTEHYQLDGHRPDVVVKFQKRTPALYPTDYERPHPNAHHAYGDTYGAHREALEFTGQEHAVLSEHCRAHGVGYACSAWDEPALDDIMGAAPRWVKIPSARNVDWPLLEHVVSRWDGDIHVSLGMVSRSEMDEIARFLEPSAERVTFYACTSGYPVAFTDVRLGEILSLRARYGRFGAIGFSGHHHGIAVDMAAVALGAKYIERHFTLNRTWRGTDHSASLEPDGFRRLVRDARAVAQAMGTKDGEPLAVELEQRAKLARTV